MICLIYNDFIEILQDHVLLTISFGFKITLHLHNQ